MLTIMRYGQMILISPKLRNFNMATKSEIIIKTKKMVKNICNKDGTFLDDPDITYHDIIKKIGQYQEPNFKVKK